MSNDCSNKLWFFVIKMSHKITERILIIYQKSFKKLKNYTKLQIRIGSSVRSIAPAWRKRKKLLKRESHLTISKIQVFDIQGVFEGSSTVSLE